MSKLKVEVTKLDIEQGTPLSPCGCPIARAVRRAFGFGESTSERMGWFDIAVIADYVEVAFADMVYLELPEKATNFIRKFDRGEPVSSFSFELNDRKYIGGK